MSDPFSPHWLVRLHDSGNPDWFVPAYHGDTFDAKFSNRIARITTPSAAATLPDPWQWLPRWAKRLYIEAQKRALVKDIPFSLSKPAMLALVWRSEGKCEVSGLPFDMALLGKGRRRPFAPSLDRIRSDGEYRFGNVRLVCMVANMAMNEWGEGPLLKLSHAIAEKFETGREHRPVTSAVTEIPKLPLRAS